MGNCTFTDFNVFILTTQIATDIILFAVTFFIIYFVVTKNKIRKSASNIILMNLLISDSIAALSTHQVRSYFDNCETISYISCTIVMFFTRTFGYISMAREIY
ncbi:hypothetical protein HZS_4605 [Henneguya salminicola]|nr:hypothetical protein HZS_4605 [Henneguya salminicola]